MPTTNYQSSTPEFSPEASIPKRRQAEVLRAERNVYGVIPFEVDVEEVQQRAVETPATAPQVEQTAAPTPVESDQTVRMLDVEEVRKAVAQIHA